MWVRSLGPEAPLEEGMATHSSVLARRIPWTEEPGGLQSMGSQTVRHDWATEHAHPEVFVYGMLAIKTWLFTTASLRSTDLGEKDNNQISKLLKKQT